MTSIRSRIQGRLIPLVLLCWITASGLVYFGTRAELRDALNAQSDLMAIVIARMQSDELDPSGFGEGLERYEDDYLIRVWSAQGELLFDSQTLLPDGRMAFPRAEKPTALGPDWRQTEYMTRSGARVLIARLKEETNELVWQVALTSLLPLALAFFGSVAAVLLFVRDGLRPLTRLSHDLMERSADDLRDLPSQDQAQELQPIVTSLNGLFTRIRGFVARERQFVDDAAHELRTPLTVIKAQCQAIDPDALDAETKARLDNIVLGVDRMANLSNQLLGQARAEQEAAPAQRIKVAPLLRGVVADLLTEADQAEVELALNCEVEPEATCLPEDLSAIVRNLIENAIKYSSRPGEVLITLTATSIRVEDNGRGVPEHLSDKVFDRFFQVPNASPPTTGAGLGLSIVQALARRNGMTVSVTKSPALAGAMFEVSLRTDPS